TDVTTLNADTYKGWIKDKKLALVELYAPWCGHCKALAPEYEKAATTLKAEGIELAKVDCTENMDLCKELDIQGFPTMIVYQNGEKSEYEGTRKADGIVSYMRKQLLPAVSILTADKVAEFAKGDEMSLIGTFSSEDSDEYREFSNAASKLRNKYLFGAVIDAKASKASITLHRKFDDPETAFTGAKISLDAIKTFLKDESIPLLDDISPQNFRDYAETKLPLAFVFYGSGEQRVDNDAAVRAVAKEFKGKVAFVHLDANKFDFMADNLNLKKEWPAFGIQKLDDMTKYPFSQEKKITTADIRSFVTDFVAGKIAASIKSEPIPEKNDGPVKVVVADQFKEIVQDKTKDVLLAYTAPWCGHCKRMKEAYEKLGTALKEAKGLVIANFNGADNDIPISDSEYQFQGFPTIKLIKADSNEVVEYNGNRTLESFVEFIAEHATHN
ncbi:protein disulfide isomerase, partial [Ramicandelaber brevisporus]